MSERVAVYGTLRPSSGGPHVASLAQQLEAQLGRTAMRQFAEGGGWPDPDTRVRFAMPALGPMLRWLGYCEIPGVLVDLRSFPGLVPGDGVVVGELFGIADPRALEIMDAYECYDASDLSRSLFVRRCVKLIQPPIDAWVYVYNREVEGRRVVPEGDWLRFVQTNR